MGCNEMGISWDFLLDCSGISMGIWLAKLVNIAFICFYDYGV